MSVLMPAARFVRSTRLAAARILTLICITLLTGCDRGLELAATEVLNNTNCKGAQDGLHLVSYADVARLRGSTLLSMSAGSQEQDSTADTPLLLFAVSAGRQPTPGYYFSLKDARLKEGAAELQLHWHTPDPDSIQAQVITHPCIVVGLEAGDFSDVRAVNQHGEMLGEIRI